MAPSCGESSPQKMEKIGQQTVKQFQWCVNKLNLKSRRFLQSPTFSSDEFQFELVLLPFGDDWGPGDHLALYLRLRKASVGARFKCFILDNRDQCICTRTANHWIAIGPQTVNVPIGYSKFAARSQVFVQDHGWIVDDALHIVCQLEYCVPYANRHGNRRLPWNSPTNDLAPQESTHYAVARTDLDIPSPARCAQSSLDCMYVDAFDMSELSRDISLRDL